MRSEHLASADFARPNGSVVPAGTDNSEPITPAQKVVLVVDDDRAICAMLRIAFEGEGFKVVTAGDAYEAIEFATTIRPDLVILDLNLPLGQGEHVAGTLDQIFRGRVPLILMSGAPGASARVQRVRAVGWFHKPFELDDLIAIVRALVGREPSRVSAPAEPSVTTRADRPSPVRLRPIGAGVLVSG